MNRIRVKTLLKRRGKMVISQPDLKTYYKATEIKRSIIFISSYINPRNQIKHRTAKQVCGFV